MKRLLPNAVPGMIELVEQMSLMIEVQSLDLTENDVIVEYGSFFGKSTHYLHLGLANRPDLNPNNKILAIDCFECSQVGGFATHVREFSELNSVNNLLVTSKDKISFYKIFGHYLSNPIQSGLVETRAEYLENLSSLADHQTIALMHIDSPKFFEELKIIMDKHFGNLRENSTIIFQDCFYHWSASLIACISLLIEFGFLTPRYSAASSLICDVNKTFEKADLRLIYDKMAEHDISVLIDKFKARCEDVQIDRKNVFLTRLELAKCQNLWEKSQKAKALRILINLIFKRSSLNKGFFIDLMELIKNKFSIRDMYETDYIGTSD